MKQEMSCPHSKTISTCPVCMIELNKITDKKSFVHSVEVAPGSYLVSPALVNEIRKRTKDSEVLGGIHGVKIMVSHLLPIEVSNNGEDED